MNSSPDLFCLRGRRNDVASIGSSSPTSIGFGFSGENEWDATRRVYSQPIFRQKLVVVRCQSLTSSTPLHSTYSPSCLLSSLRASEGHQNRETKPAHTTPIVTAVERWNAISTTDMSSCREL